MKKIARLLVGVVGLFNIFMGFSFLFNATKMAGNFALSPIGTQGLATVRADLPGFFLTAGAFAIFGAWQKSRQALLVPIMLLGIALFGRFLSIILDGIAATTFPPMIAEAIMIAMLYAGYRAFKKPLRY
jgi:hypothetical protein